MELKYVELKNEGITWYPLIFHTGSLLLLKKIYDFILSFIVILRIRLLYNTLLLVSLSNISASYCYVISRLLSTKLLVFNYEPHSDFLVEQNIWNVKSFKYQFLNRLENLVGLRGDYILTGTDHMVELLSTRGSRGKIFRAPSSLNSNIYMYDSQRRQAIRKKYGIEDKKVLLYLGKFGGIYYGQEIADLCKYLSDKIDDLCCLIVTPCDHKEVRYYFDKADINAKQYMITEAFNREEVIGFISSADIGLSAVPPTPAQKYRSPIKTGEYLLCGLPYITCAGISEDDKYARDLNVGVVVKSFNNKDIEKERLNIESFLQEEKEKLRTRCRNAGIDYRDKKNVEQILDKIMNEVFARYNWMTKTKL